MATFTFSSPQPFRNEIKEFIGSRGLITIFLLIGIIKLILISFDPLVTTDLERNLWYGRQFWNVFFDVYRLTPFEIDPNFNIIDPTTGLFAWPDNTYDYPILSILLYALIAMIPVGIASQMLITKMFFVAVEVLNFFLLRQIDTSDSKILSWVYWIVVIPFSSIEGQPVSVTIFFFLLIIWLYKKYPNPSYAFIALALGFHFKYVPLLVLPYLGLEIFYRTILSHRKNKILWRDFFIPIGAFSLVFIILSFPILVSPYILSYISFGGNLPVTGDPWNPFYLGFPLTLSGFMLLGLILYIIVSWLYYSYKNRTDIWMGIGIIPLLSLWGFLLIYKYAFPWYWLWAIPLFTLLPKNQQKILGIFIGICSITAIEFINWTVGFDGFIQLFNL